MAWAIEHRGTVRAGDGPAPGAGVTATAGDRKLTTYTDAEGRYAFTDLPEGEWTLRVELFGFEPAERTIAAGAAEPTVWTLELAPPPSAAPKASGAPERPAARGRRREDAGAAPAAGPAAGGAGRGRFAQVQVSQVETQIQQLEQQALAQDPFVAQQMAQGANESFLVNGSLSAGLNAPAFQGPGGFPGGPGGFSGGFDGPGGVGAQAPGDPFSQGRNGEPSLSADAGPGPGGFGGGGFGGPGGPGGGFGGGRGPGGGGPGGRGPGAGPGGGRGPGADGRRPDPERVAEFMRRRRNMVFGNRSNRGRPSMRGSLDWNFGNSALDARPFSLTGEKIQKPSYAQNRFGATIGGPLRIPKLIDDSKTFLFLSYRGSRSRNGQTLFATLPSALERAGDFSQSVNNVSIFDPATGEAFPNQLVPASRIDPAAIGLQSYIPLPNLPGQVRNYQFVASIPNNSDNFSARLMRSVSDKDRLALSYSLQTRNSQAIQLFGFRDSSSGKGQNANLSWTRNVSPNVVATVRVGYSRDRNETLPYFAYGEDVAGRLGITGTSDNPVNYGPPNLSFTNFGNLNDGSPSLRANQTFSVTPGVTLVRGDHNISLGADFRQLQRNSIAEPNGRGSFTFSGVGTSQYAADGRVVPNTGSDYADFLLGMPQSSSIRFGNPDTYFRANAANVYAQDDWRIAPNFSLNAGLRWEYQPPFHEKYDRLANLDVAPYFTAVEAVRPGQSGSYTGVFPRGLIQSDKNNWAPRIGLAWKPQAKESLTVRAGYGLYYNGSVYNQAVSQLAQQPPFAVTTTLISSVDGQLTLADGFASYPATDITNTYAVARNYVVGYAQTWNLSVQRSLPWDLVLEVGYLGTKGTRLDIQRSPNRTIEGEDRQISNAVGFLYDSSEGNSIFHAGQARLVRRFRGGLSFNSTYQWAKSIDNVSTFGGGGAVVAQNDRNLSAERGRSSFDVRHTFNTGWVWTSPIGQGFGPQPKLWWQRLLKSWTLNGNVTANSGAPLTAQIRGNLSNTGGSGVIGSGRADATGLPIDAGDGFFNTAAFTTPAANALGNAGRNTIPGPKMFAVNMSFGRSFRLDDSRRSLEVRAQAQNVFNQVNYRSLGTTINASNYGLATAAADMRSLSLSLRIRF